MRFQVVTIFPELIERFAELGLIGKACSADVIAIETESPRDHAKDRHRSVDDTPYGGGSGMVMSPEPAVAAIEALDARAARRGQAPARRVLMSAGGRPFDHARALELAEREALMLVCGRYEGVDDRVRQLCDEELSLGDFVLNGGEIAALAVIEAVARLLPSVLGNARSLDEESHAQGMLEYPQFTRPRSFRGREVPEVLLSGNHAAIGRWRRGQALLRTRRLRPDLFAKLDLGAEDREALAEAEREARDGKGTDG